jgi:adenine/guanine phosphoribosyltransferase-like PRPP-binding protein
LIKRLGGEVVEVACLIELAFLKGRERLTEAPFRAVITY